jgi:hypothetical protein
LVLLIALFRVFDLHLQHGLASLETTHSLIFPFTVAGLLFFLDDLLYLLELCLNVGSKFAHLKGGHNVILIDSFHTELIVLKVVDIIVFQLLSLSLSILLIPGQLFLGLLLLLIHSFLKGCSILRIHDELLRAQLSQFIILALIGFQDLLEHSLQLLDLFQFSKLYFLCLRKFHVLFGLQFVIL